MKMMNILKQLTVKVFGRPESNTIFVLGTNPNENTEALLDGETRSNMEVYSVRIYNRCLTEDEINHNYEIDKARFGITE